MYYQLKLYAILAIAICTVNQLSHAIQMKLLLDNIIYCH